MKSKCSKCGIVPICLVNYSKGIGFPLWLCNDCAIHADLIKR